MQGMAIPLQGAATGDHGQNLPTSKAAVRLSSNSPAAHTNLVKGLQLEWVCALRMLLVASLQNELQQ